MELSSLTSTTVTAASATATSISRFGADIDPTEDTLSPLVWFPFLVAVILSALFVTFRRVQATELYDHWKLRLLDYLPTRSGSIRLSEDERHQAMQDNGRSLENDDDDADSMDSNDDELPTSTYPPSGSRATWNRVFDSFLRIGRMDSAASSGTGRNAGIGSAFWGRRNATRLSTSSGQRRSNGIRLGAGNGGGSARDGAGRGAASRLFDVGEEDEHEDAAAMELPQEFDLPTSSSSNRMRH